MLSATPVNNRFNDLKNQLALAYEGHTDYIDEKLNTSRSIDEIFRNAQRAFNTWSKWEPCDRTTENLLKMLDFDFFELLDSVTIARSRRHIQKASTAPYLSACICRVRDSIRHWRMILISTSSKGIFFFRPGFIASAMSHKRRARVSI